MSLSPFKQQFVYEYLSFMDMLGSYFCLIKKSVAVYNSIFWQ